MATIKYKTKTENGTEWLPIGVKILGEVGGGKKYLHCLDITYGNSFYLLTIPMSDKTPITTTTALYEFFINAGITKTTRYPLSGQFYYDTDETYGLATYLEVNTEKEGLFAHAMWSTKEMSDTLYRKDTPFYAARATVVDTVIEF